MLMPNKSCLEYEFQGKFVFIKGKKDFQGYIFFLDKNKSFNNLKRGIKKRLFLWVFKHQSIILS